MYNNFYNFNDLNNFNNFNNSNVFNNLSFYSMDPYPLYSNGTGSDLTYYIRPGDTLYKIGSLYNISVDELKKANNLTGNIIYPGHAIIIPDFTLPEGVYVPGSSGEEVKKIQLALYAMGNDLIVDGNYDTRTADLIRSIQMKFPEALTVDGIYNPDTKSYLELLIAKKYRIIQNPASLLALVNKQNSLPYDYVPADMVVPNVPFSIEEYDPRKLMRSEAAKALEQLFAQAERENILLTGVSAYRSFDRQAEIFKQNILASPSANMTSARPGESEHQTGLSIDVSSPSVNNDLTESFGDTREGQWLAKNAPAFGFIIRFPKGKEAITGYQYEPWHIRYVGKNAANQIAAGNLTLEEYLHQPSM